MSQVQTKQELLSRLDKDVGVNLKKSKLGCFSKLMTSLFNHASNRDLESYQYDDLKGLAVSLWRMVQSRKDVVIDVYNPNVEEHDWQSSHTVVAILAPDLPFIIDSIRMALTRQGLGLHGIFHAALQSNRKKDGSLQSLDGEQKEILLYIEVDHRSDEIDRQSILKDCAAVLKEIVDVTDDYSEMCQVVESVSQEIKDLGKNKKVLEKLGAQDHKEALVFLDWLKDNHFTFLACDQFTLKEDKLSDVKGSQLGLFKDKVTTKVENVGDLSESMAAFVYQASFLTFSKSGRKSTIHRPAYSDYIIVKKFDKEGNVVGGYRFLGLYTSAVYNHSPMLIPVVRKKIETVVEQSGFEKGSHNHKEIVQVLMVHPRDELIQSSVKDLLSVSKEVLAIQDRRSVRLFLRQDLYGKFVSAIVYMPKDVYNTQIRHKMQGLLESQMNVESTNFNTSFSESVLARTHFVFRLKEPLNELLLTEKLERQLKTLARSWTDDLNQAMVESFGEEEGNRLIDKYHDSFPSSYISQYSARVAVADVQRMQGLFDDDLTSLGLSFYRTQDANYTELKLKIYHQNKALLLSDLIPVLENFGLKVIDEYPYQVTCSDNQFIWIYDFSLLYEPNVDINPSDFKELFSQAFKHVWYNDAENDHFNQLVLRSKIEWRDVVMLRAFSRYMKQIRFGFSQQYIAETLIKNQAITAGLVEIFHQRFDHRQNVDSSALEKNIEELLDNVANLNEDRILRRYLELMGAVLRTNFYQNDDNGKQKQYVSFKINSRSLEGVPEPRPMFEIFVYSPRVEGVHLRGGKVARGGLRWSDRIEDYRTEVLGLVKAQQVKNAVIVPVGAKGGFVAKQLPSASNREAFLKEGVSCYQIFIKGLLDLSDNLEDGNVVPAKQVRRFDEDDPYLVVAADKGTATFSDIANELSEQYQFWLGDAFASGGSNGYDHKKMGITAKGAWVSVQRHFRELGIDVQSQAFTVVGIGDMAGDVFGNGLLCSSKACLVAAFNHMHIFVDPNPVAEASFKERQRMFDLPRSSWTDYDKSLISEGGGIFERSAKSINISPEMKKCFGIKESKLTPTALITAILKSQVDLIWNGGIGTYIKASSETHADVGDKANDILRINGSEVKAKVIGEGGNLGVTQLGRIEYALTGGRSFTDFIDNAAGVNCSDHEVNIKILLDDLVANGDLTVKQRNQWLLNMTDDISKKVLTDNYRQDQAIALSFSESFARIGEHRRQIIGWENEGKLNRALEFLPDEEQIGERKAQELGLSRPELSILISYAKGDLKEMLIQASAVDDPYLEKEVEHAFPNQLVEKYPQSVYQHRLKGEIVATQIANDLFNHMSVSYLNRMQESTGSEPLEIAKSYVLIRDIFGLKDIWRSIEQLDFKVDVNIQNKLMLKSSRTVRLASRWILKNNRLGINVENMVKEISQPLMDYSKSLKQIIGEERYKLMMEHQAQLSGFGLPTDVAEQISRLDYLYYGLAVIAVAKQINKPVETVGKAFFKLGDLLGLDDFSEQLLHLTINSHWQALARESFRDDLEWQQRRITQGVLHNIESNQSVDECLEQWINTNKPLVERWNRMMIDIRSTNDPEFSMYSVAIRELLDLSQATIVQ